MIIMGEVLVAVRMCDIIKKVSQMVETCDGYAGDVKVLGGGGCVTVVRECDGHQGGVKGTRKLCQFYVEV